MKKAFYFLVFIPLFLLSGCDSDDCDNHHHDIIIDNNNNHVDDESNKVLMLKIIGNVFGGGIEYLYNQPTDSFTIDPITQNMENYSTIRLKYRELDRTLFYGTILQYGYGAMTMPEYLDASEFFDTVLTDDVIYPASGFSYVGSAIVLQSSYYNLWMKVQKLEKVREYLRSNPTQKVNFYFYDPSVDQTDHQNSYWLIFLKN